MVTLPPYTACDRVQAHQGVLGAVFLLLFLVPQLGQARCNRFDIDGLYGLSTEGIGPSAQTVATLSLFDFVPKQNLVREIYYVDTVDGQSKSSALGSYSVSVDCRFTLDVVNLDGVHYVLEGELDPKGRTVQVMQTIPKNASVALGVMRRVGLKRCSAATVSGEYVFLSQGLDNGVYQARLGRVKTNVLGFDQTAERVNSEGVVSLSPPALIPFNVARNCTAQLLDGGYPAVIVDGGKGLLYLAGGAGTIRAGQFIISR